MTTIWLDMDGTIADLYGVEGWLEMLTAHDATPYAEAKPLVRMATLARLLNNRQRNGYKIGIVSALARNSNAEYDECIKNAKREWLAKHLHSVKFDEIRFVPYTFKKNDVNNGKDILFDDEAPNREHWKGDAYEPEMIIKVLKHLLSVS